MFWSLLTFTVRLVAISLIFKSSVEIYLVNDKSNTAVVAESIKFFNLMRDSFGLNFSEFPVWVTRN
jgi:hypothetical protein